MPQSTGHKHARAVGEMPQAALGDLPSESLKRSGCEVRHRQEHLIHSCQQLLTQPLLALPTYNRTGADADEVSLLTGE